MTTHSTTRLSGRGGVTRRGFLAGAGVGGAALVGGPLLAAGPASAGDAGDSGADGLAAPAPADPVTTPRVAGLHTQFGADAAREVVVSWHTPSPVGSPRVFFGAGPVLGRMAVARSTSYTDAQSGQVVHAHHTRLTGLRPGTTYRYAAVHDGATPELATFTTGPAGRARFTFTSFGDQGTPTLGKKNDAGVWVNDNLGAPAAGDTTAGVERVAPLFHLFNGDLCYANLATDRVRTWSDFWENNTRSARNRPWMPSAGNHENELGNGPIGYTAYQTYFSVPPAGGQTDTTRGLWYSFTVGSVRVISLANDDVCYQDGGNSYVRGYSGGAQKRWLEAELRGARADRGIDWVVVCMHQVAISTADPANGADLGIRQEWVPLFDRYGVDLVVCGHEHHYERTHPIRGQQATPTLTPVVANTRLDVVDTTQGTVHIILGGGGTRVTSNQLLTNPPHCRVITAVGNPDATTGKRAPVYVTEPAAWSANRDAAHSYGFASFTVDPGGRDGTTTITVTYLDVTGPYGQLTPFETFTLRRTRSDARR